MYMQIILHTPLILENPGSATATIGKVSKHMSFHKNKDERKDVFCFAMKYLKS